MNKVWKAIKSSLDLTKPTNFYRMFALIFGGMTGDSVSRGWLVWTGVFAVLTLVTLIEYYAAVRDEKFNPKTTTVTFYGDIPSAETAKELADKVKKYVPGGVV